MSNDPSSTAAEFPNILPMGALSRRTGMPDLRRTVTWAILIASVLTLLAVVHSRQQNHCLHPLTYRIGSVDPRFGLSRKDVSDAIRDAAAIWSRASGRELFREDQKGAVEITFVYDYRQAAADKLKGISGEIGKTIIFCVSQNHAAKITQILNEMADKMFPGKYNSDFAIQVTSCIPDAQQFTLNFANNRLSGSYNFNPFYKTSKTRVCVTVGMMTTGYDCQDILNLCLMRPIFSPTEFVQIKGRGTRRYNFTNDLTDPRLKTQLGEKQKLNYKLFDFFANCEYFEEEYNYDEVLKLPIISSCDLSDKTLKPPLGVSCYENKEPDYIIKLSNSVIGPDGMKVDRMYFEKFEKTILEHPVIKEKADTGRWEELLDYIEKNILNKPEDYFNLEKLRASIQVDRRISMKEIIEKILGIIPYFKTEEELLEEEYDKFDSKYLPKEEYFDYAKTVFKAYICDIDFRKIIDEGNYALLNINPYGEAFNKLPPNLRKAIPEYIKDYVSLNKFVA